MTLRDAPRIQPGTPDAIEYASDWYRGTLDDAKRKRIADGGGQVVDVPGGYCILRDKTATRISNLDTRITDTVRAPSRQAGIMIVTSKPNPAGWERVEHVMLDALDYTPPAEPTP